MSAREFHTEVVGSAPGAQSLEDDPLSRLLNARPVANEFPAGAGGVVVGRLVGMGELGQPLVLVPNDPVALAARSVVDLERSHIGREVVLAFEGGDRLRPLVMGVMRDAQACAAPEAAAGQVEVDVDGNRMVVSARRELVLRCGAASITLDHEGRITIRGTQVTSHSAGVNRIRGGSVQLN